MRKLVLAAALTLGLAACGGGAGATSDGAPTGGNGATGATGSGASSDCVDFTATGKPAVITIKDFGFHPGCFTVSAAAGLTIKNEDKSAHSFSAEQGVIDQTIASGDTFKIKSLSDVAPGTYAFACRFHPPMTGTMTVVP